MLSPQPTLGRALLPPAPITDAQWGQIHALFPPPSAGRGRPRADDRRVLDAILYKLRTGCAWAAVPAEWGDEATAHRRWSHWKATGVWEHICATLGAAPTDR